MDPAAFTALVERCAPAAMVEPLAAIVRQASAFEPLLITIEGRKPIPIQATDRDEAIQLTTEAIATGQPVRSGLAQLDAGEIKRAGLTIATTFDACQHVAGLSRLFEARLRAAQTNVSDRGQATATVVASFATGARSAAPELPTRDPVAPARAETLVDTSAIKSPTANTTAIEERSNRDVYRSSRGTSVFVYQR